MFCLEVAEHLVPARGREVAESASENLSLGIALNVGNNLLFSCCNHLCKPKRVKNSRTYILCKQIEPPLDFNSSDIWKKNRISIVSSKTYTLVRFC